MARKKETKIAVAPTIKAMLKNESVVFPMSRHITVRSACSSITINEPKKKFTANIDREAGTITVTRTA